MKAMIFAAGLGTRFKPWTDNHPKALAMVNKKTLLERTIRYLQRHGIFEVVINVHHFADQIEAQLREHGGWGSQITISDERGELLETGGGLMRASWYFNKEPFLVINVDILTDLDLTAMIGYHLDRKPLATLAVTSRMSSRYFLFNQENLLCGWKNTKTGEEKGPVLSYPEVERKQVSAKAFSGIHIIDPRLFPLVRQKGKFSIVDTYLDLSAHHPIRSFEQLSCKLVDVGRPESVAIAEALFP